MLRRDGTIDRLESTGTVLGLFQEWDCSINELSLYSGDTLALYTDGITEFFNDAGQDFGEERLIEALRRHRGLSPHAMLEATIGNVQRFSRHEQHDDITLTIAKCR